MSLTE